MNLQILLESRDNLPGDNIRRAMEDSSQNQAKLDCARDNLNKEKSFPNYKANSALSFFFFYTLLWTTSPDYECTLE